MKKEQLNKLLSVASDSEMPIDVLNNLYDVVKNDEEASLKIKEALSLNRSSSTELLDKLFKEQNRLKEDNNEDNNEDSLLITAKIKNIRLNVVKHLNISQKSLSSAVKDPDSDIRIMALNNPNISENDLWILTRDKDSSVSCKARIQLKARL